MKEKLQQIKEKCISANPEIVELKFGCEVLIDNGSLLKIVEDVSFDIFPYLFGDNILQTIPQLQNAIKQLSHFESIDSLSKKP